jgi:hypothetical protein
LAFQDFITAQQRNLESALKFELFGATCPLMDKLYELSVATVPKDKSPFFGQFLLVCHKSFLAAATLIGQGQPDDSAPITRRAIEVVRLAAAIKVDPKFAKEWLAYEKRQERWDARDKGEKPKSLHIPVPVTHPLVKQLMDTWGIFSDGEVHVTPEYFGSLGWEKGDDRMFLQDFTGDQRTTEAAIVLLLGAHMMMLRVLDECLDGSFTRSDAWREISDQLYVRAKPWADKLE